MVCNSASDRELVEFWIAGNEKAFEKLFFRYFPRLHRYCRRFVSDRPTSEEIVMDVLMKVWQKKATINPEQSFSSYIFRSLSNRVIDHLRKGRVRMYTLEEHSLSASYAFVADNVVLQKEMDLHYSESIDRLSPQQRRVFMMSRVDGKSYKEIACNLNLSRNTVENHMVASLRQMKTYVRESVI